MIDGAHNPAVAAPALGDDTEAVLAESVGADELARLLESRVVATSSDADRR